ncbi:MULTISPECIES: ABC transporter substrate-binding protein [Pseudomonas]|uniref:ABC transporter substrate-binding protein n=1 Tax=Pseudomonas TaxID=286 RepID=UPI0015C0E12F|nr:MULTISPECIES: ABC transporter substrate-binding protein [Pseudomonas]MBX5668822.1 ABC transporter substrate-binding protein [Pseudomonas aeruginosa]MBX5679103.1 ABC transporter substrate-binding protein [Pseudomonas aeruginosa]MBX5753426.1 ABC transporter substrate-binding protein [Pseudomonas aeruginosa]MBX6073706.1 ABC transporter substrate-binding protein [Pseudomonas aeruginosa]MBX6117708.1 ABC transporter substrate-binding protein [Pseudomonas aeruginosa]
MEYSDPILAENLIGLISPALVGSRNFADFPTSWAGMRIGLNSGFAGAHNPQFHDMIDNGELDLSYARTNRINLLKLLHGRIDAYINDRRSIMWELELMHKEGLISRPESARFVWGPALSTEHGYLGYTNVKTEAYPYKADFMKQFNQALAQIIKEGAVEKLLHQYGLDSPN